MKKRWISSALIVTLIFLSAIFIQLSILKVDDNSKQTTTETKSMSSLGNGLTVRNKLGNSELSERQNTELSVINQKIEKKSYVGAFLEISNNRINYSNGRGYADAGSKTAFKLDSAFWVGNYQSLINNAMLIKLVNEDKVNLSDSANKYISSLGNLTVKQLLLGSQHVYISNKDIAQLSATKYSTVKNITLGTKKKSDTVSADSIVIGILLCRILNKSYDEVLNQNIVSKLSLNNTRINDVETTSYANDVKSYKYHLSGNIPVQSVEQKESTVMFGNDLRMSTEDIAYSFYKIMNSEYFSGKYQQLFIKSIPSNLIRQEKSDGNIELKISKHGQTILLKYRKNAVLLIATNYPNVKLKNETLLNLLDQLM